MCPFPHLSYQTQVHQSSNDNYDWQGTMQDYQLPLGKLFPVLPSFSMQDDYRKGIADIMTSNGSNNSAESGIPIGYAFFKLFVEHDLTFGLFHQMASNGSSSSPSLDLFSLYGNNPQAQPYLFNAKDPARFLLVENEENGRLELPTNNQGQSLIADVRNLKHPALEELHILFCIFHNQVVDYLRAKGKKTNLFTKAQQLVRWHYHWLIINDLLPTICSENALDQINKFKQEPSHVVRNKELPVEALLAAMRFDNALLSNYDNYRPDDWRDEFLFENNTPYYTDTIRASCINFQNISTIFPLTQLIKEDGCDIMLQLGQQLGLPSGEALSKVYGVEPLSKNQLNTISLLEEIHSHTNFYELNHFETPLWYYFLKEAEEQENGQRLGETGSYVLIETLQSLLYQDTSSYFLLYPNWRPIFGTTNNSFTMSDLVIFTGLNQKRISA